MDVEFWADARGQEPVREYIDAIEAAGEGSQVLTFRRLLGQLEEHGPDLRMPRSRMINRRDRLYELRFGDHRCAYAEDGDSIVLLHAWRKRTQRLDAREERRALSRLAQLHESRAD